MVRNARNQCFEVDGLEVQVFFSKVLCLAANGCLHDGVCFFYMVYIRLHLLLLLSSKRFGLNDSFLFRDSPILYRGNYCSETLWGQ